MSSQGRWAEVAGDVTRNGCRCGFIHQVPVNTYCASSPFWVLGVSP